MNACGRTIFVDVHAPITSGRSCVMSHETDDETVSKHQPRQRGRVVDQSDCSAPNGGCTAYGDEQVRQVGLSAFA